MSGVKGKSGRRPLSLREHVAAGTYRQDRHGPLPPGGREAVLATGATLLRMPTPAECIGEDIDGAAFVARVRAQFTDWPAQDLALLDLAGQQFDRLREIRALIAKGGIVSGGLFGSSVSLSSLLRVERQTVTAIAQLLKQINFED